ncbi:hypothetical protein MKL09_11065 [Methylobacterium sp. J-048]|uniref:hypothetical protein n=1 Tax=unclassified Methylobacterium TaxID=2615210 RepID=UPI001FBBF9C5|nr:MULTISPECIES: hypothetical protein [unclassified Methylobacterium]MCJ2057094.1 hypothetical protein [Methylobacterium sp. J-048]MCJ2143885.1 hypothetical protein [Methylobacterium sp. E-066]
MNTIKKLISNFAEFMSARPGRAENHQLLASEDERGSGARATKTPKDFSGDYRIATDMLRDRINRRFPDNFHARVGSNANSMHDFGDERAGAIDMSSSVIAAALRDGATARQAADAGAASVGI